MTSQRITICITTAMAFSACSPDAGPSDRTPDVVRGEYLVNSVLACGDCHTPRSGSWVLDEGRALAGNSDFVRVNGTLLNAPPIQASALAALIETPEEFDDAFRGGVRVLPNGMSRTLAADMPYWAFRNLTDEDAADVEAYLRTVSGSSAAATNNDPNPLPPTVLSPDQVPLPTVVNDETLRGRYLAGLAGACVHCHTPEVSPGVPDFTKLFAGGRVYTRADDYLPRYYPDEVVSTNLTPHSTGLMGWTQQEVVDVLLTGRDRDGEGLCLPMRAGPGTAHGSMRVEDANAIAAYLLALPPIAQPGTLASCVDVVPGILTTSLDLAVTQPEGFEFYFYLSTSPAGITKDIDFNRTPTSFPYEYTETNLAAGTYYVVAFYDLDEDSVPTPGDVGAISAPVAFTPGSTFPVALSLDTLPTP